MRRPVPVLLLAAVLALAGSAVAQGAILGAPDFSVSPFTKAQAGAGNVVSATLVWLPPTFSPASGSDKQEVWVTDITGGGATDKFSAASSASSMPLLLSNGHDYTFTVLACTGTCDPSSVNTTSTARITRIDATPPAGTVQINGGAAATNSRDVTLSLTASDPLIGGVPGTSSGVNQVAADVDGDGSTPCLFFTPSDTTGCAVAFAPTIPVTLPAGADGVRKVGAYFGDAARQNTAPCAHPLLCVHLLGSFIDGNRSAEAFDEILLDTVKPVAVPSPAAVSIVRGQDVTMSAGGSTDAAPASGVVASTAVWTFADGTPSASGATVTHTYSATGTFVGSLRVKDAAGNLSDPRAFAVTVAPKPGETLNGSGSVAGIRGTAGFSVSRLKVKARYARSRLIGSVSVVGTSTQAGSLRLALRRGTSGTGRVLRARASRVGTAGFTKSLTLPRNLRPGQYTLTLAGPGGSLSTVLTLTPPREGVLSKAVVSVRGRRSARAAFVFAATPIVKLRSNLTVTWSQGGRILGVVPVSFARAFAAALPSGATLSPGPLRATLRASAIVVGSATATVR